MSNKKSNKRKSNRGSYKPHNSNRNHSDNTKDRDFHGQKNTDQNFDAIHSNDIGWYNKSVMYSDAVRIPFNHIHGDPIRCADILPTKGGDKFNPLYTHMAEPGIMRIMYAPTVGISNNSNSEINRCYTSIYGDIYSKTTGAMQFQQADLALLSLGLSSIMSNIALVKRALGLSTLFAEQNYYMPKALIRACGIEPATVMGRQDEVRRRLNTYISNVNAMKMPNFIDLFKRHYQLPLNVYADEDDIRAQFYAFMPEGYYVYHDVSSDISDVSCLEYKQFDLTGKGKCMDVDALLDIIDEQLAAWRNSSDLGIISGSIQRAYADSQLITLDYTPLDYLTIPTCDRIMLYQINNATLCGAVVPSSMHITQDVLMNAIISKPSITSNAAGMAATVQRHILNSFDGNTGDEFIMEATRLMIATDNVGAVTVCGTEIPTTAMIYLLTRKDGSDEIEESGYQYNASTVVETSMNANQLYNILSTLPLVTKFRNAPRSYQLVQDASSDTVKYYFTPWFGDLYRYTTVDNQALTALMNAAYQSIYVVNERTNIK